MGCPALHPWPARSGVRPPLRRAVEPPDQSPIRFTWPHTDRAAPSTRSGAHSIAWRSFVQRRSSRPSAGRVRRPSLSSLGKDTSIAPALPAAVERLRGLRGRPMKPSPRWIKGRSCANNKLDHSGGAEQMLILQALGALEASLFAACWRAHGLWQSSLNPPPPPLCRLSGLWRAVANSALPPHDDPQPDTMGFGA